MDKTQPSSPLAIASPGDSSPGRDVINVVLDRLEREGGWTAPRKDGFTYLGSGHATHVWADPPVFDDGFHLSRLHVETDFVRRAEKADDSALACLNNLFLNAIIRDPDDPTRLRLHASFFVHHDIANWVGPLFGQVIRLQAIEAARAVSPVAAQLGGVPDLTPHPEAGPRPDFDIVLEGFEAFARRRGEAPCAWPSDDYIDLARIFQRPPCLHAVADVSGLSAEFPFLGGSSLVTFVTNEDHPSLGPGLLVMLRLPGVMDDGDAATLAMRLNGLERTAETGVAFTGSWCSDEKSVAWVSFFPNVVQQRGPLSLLGVNMLGRAHFTATKVYGDDWTRVPARCALERMAEPEVPS